LAQAVARKNAAAVYPNEVGAPEAGIRRNCDLLTPQADHLDAWYLKHGFNRHGCLYFFRRSGLVKWLPMGFLKIFGRAGVASMSASDLEINGTEWIAPVRSHDRQ
jgi:hypothetical protein